MNSIKGKSGRENYIIQLLSQKGSLKTSNLSKDLQASRETIRRDLKNLEKKGLLQCVYGGAILDTPASLHYDTSANVKCVEEKDSIGKKAAEFIKDYEAIIILGSSSTTKMVGPYLNEKNYLTVITNSFVIAKYALQNQTNSVIILGGKYDNNLQSTTGNVAAASLDCYRADKLLFCPRGVSPQYGITNYPESDTHVIQAALSVSKTSILLADYTKFGVVGLHKVCDISDIDIIISDWNLSQKKIAELASEKVQVIIADDIEA